MHAVFVKVHIGKAAARLSALAQRSVSRVRCSSGSAVTRLALVGCSRIKSQASPAQLAPPALFLDARYLQPSRLDSGERLRHHFAGMGASTKA
jgi:hypothetical protein